MPPASLGDSPRSAGGFDPGSFQMTASALGPRACEILYVPFKSEVSYFPQPSGSCESQSHWYSKLDVLGACLVQDPWSWGAQCGAQTCCSLWRTSAIVIILLLVNCPLKGMGSDYMGSDYTATLPLLPISLWFFLCIFSCRRSFLLDSGLSYQ